MISYDYMGSLVDKYMYIYICRLEDIQTAVNPLNKSEKKN